MQYKDPNYSKFITDSLSGKKCICCGAKLKMSDMSSCEECIAALKEVVLNQRKNMKINKNSIVVCSEHSFPMRLWIFITNPFRYIFTGKIKY